MGKSWSALIACNSGKADPRKASLRPINGGVCCRCAAVSRRAKWQISGDRKPSSESERAFIEISSPDDSRRELETRPGNLNESAPVPHAREQAGRPLWVTGSACSSNGGPMGTCAAACRAVIGLSENKRPISQQCNISSPPFHHFSPVYLQHAQTNDVTSEHRAKWPQHGRLVRD